VQQWNGTLYDILSQ